MDWEIEIIKITGEEDCTREVLQRCGYEFRKRENEQIMTEWLHHSKYKIFTSCGEVDFDSQKIVSRLREILRLNVANLGIEFGVIKQLINDSSTQQYIILRPFAMTAISTCTVEVEIIKNPNISDEQRQASQRKFDQQMKTKEVNLAVAAMTKPSIIKIMKLISVPRPSVTQLGHIVDLIVEDCNGDITEFASKNEKERFYRSINHPQVMGLESRHAVSKQEPPPLCA
jgi:hypothetical protein